MSITKYELKKDSINIRYKDRDAIVRGCTASKLDAEPELIESFDDKEKALEALADYGTDIHRLTDAVGMYFEVTEYYVEENVYDDDGDFESGGDVVEFSEMPEYDFGN